MNDIDDRLAESIKRYEQQLNRPYRSRASMSFGNSAPGYRPTRPSRQTDEGGGGGVGAGMMIIGLIFLFLPFMHIFGLAMLCIGGFVLMVSDMGTGGTPVMFMTSKDLEETIRRARR